MSLKFKIDNIVLQPTSYCNLNCSYCYLPDRSKVLLMTKEITTRLAEQIRSNGRSVKILWHGGEPTSSGLKHFTEISAPFIDLEKDGIISHRIQTNASLINDKWIEFFKKRNFEVGVSIDGPELLNRNRVNWGGKASYKLVYEGIKRIKDAGIEFGVLAVLHEKNINYPEDIYEFFCQLGCKWLGFNIEEKLGVHENSYTNSSQVKKFFEQLYYCWITNPKIEIRELSDIIKWFGDVLNDTTIFNYYDLFPTIGYNGDFVYLSPEFLSDKPIFKNYNFVIGNILYDNLFEKAKNCKKVDYISDYIQGVNKCKQECENFSMCKGGTGGNKYFETGTLNTTETYFCINSIKMPAQVIFEQLNI